MGREEDTHVNEEEDQTEPCKENIISSFPRALHPRHERKRGDNPLLPSHPRSLHTQGAESATTLAGVPWWTGTEGPQPLLWKGHQSRVVHRALTPVPGTQTIAIHFPRQDLGASMALHRFCAQVGVSGCLYSRATVWRAVYSSLTALRQSTARKMNGWAQTYLTEFFCRR